MIERWSSDASTRGLSRQTIETYVKALRAFSRFLGSRTMEDASKMDVRAFVDMKRKQGVTTRTIRGRLNALSSFYEFLIFEGIRSDNPVQEVRKRYLTQYKASSEEHTHKLISIEDMARLVNSMIDIRNKAMLLVMAKTGIRRGELLSMEIQDINWQNQSILLKEKRKRSNRIVFFDDETAYVLRRWLEIRESRTPHDKSLWIDTCGKRIDSGALRYNVEKAALLCGLHNPDSDRMEDHFTPHCCRHWMATHLLRAGMNRDYVKWLRGDAMKEAIDIYNHIDSEDVRRSYLAHVPQLGV